MRRTFCSEMGAREAKKWQLARPRGFEPLAPRFVAWCSVQLSYGRVNVALSWNCVEASILCGFSTMRLGRDTRGYQTAGEAWESARQEFEAATRPQERSCTRERSETCPKGRAQDVCGSIRSHPREKRIFAFTTSYRADSMASPLQSSPGVSHVSEPEHWRLHLCLKTRTMS